MSAEVEEIVRLSLVEALRLTSTEEETLEVLSVTEVPARILAEIERRLATAYEVSYFFSADSLEQAASYEDTVENHESVFDANFTSILNSYFAEAFFTVEATGIYSHVDVVTSTTSFLYRYYPSSSTETGAEVGIIIAVAVAMCCCLCCGVAYRNRNRSAREEKPRVPEQDSTVPVAEEDNHAAAPPSTGASSPVPASLPPVPSHRSPMDSPPEMVLSLAPIPYPEELDELSDLLAVPDDTSNGDEA